MKVRFNGRARADLFAQLDWLEHRSRDAALRAADQISSIVIQLGEFPESGPLIDDQNREVTVRFGRDGFVLRYRLDQEGVVIVRLYHGRQARHEPT
ncbi:MAG: type II toxin-antitoxin system RelE/ParE family toxin [Phenylobacterium sp.]|nr:type II toxin-antitoxin system RelE/ParE family toxin [Phenylobacterium sp.]